MEILSGSFGAGRGQLLSGKLEIRPNAIFSGASTIYASEIASLDAIGGHAQKKVGEAAGLGVTGAVVGSLLGPVGTLAGAAVGIMAGGKTDKVTFGCRLLDGRSFVARSSAAEFYELQTYFAKFNSTADSVGAEEEAPPPRAKKKSRKRTGRGRPKPVVISGRAEATPPEATCSAYSALKAALSSASAGSVPHSVISSVLSYAQTLHEVKWRYFDETLDNTDVKHAVLLKLVSDNVRERRLEEYENEVVGNLEADDSKLDKCQREIRASADSFSAKFFGKGPDAWLLKEEADLKLRIEGNEWQWEDVKKKRAEITEHIVCIKQLTPFPISEQESADYLAGYADLVPLPGSGQLALALTPAIALEHLQELHPQIGEALSVASVAPVARCVEERLRQLKSLADQDLITEQEYTERRRAILESI